MTKLQASPGSSDSKRVEQRKPRQHKTPCAKCPFRRTALNGWLGGHSPVSFLHLAIAEIPMPCHTRVKDIDYADFAANFNLPQCAGRAVYWANTSKKPRDERLLELPADKAAIFDRPQDFIEHHLSLPGTRLTTGARVVCEVSTLSAKDPSHV